MLNIDDKRLEIINQKICVGNIEKIYKNEVHKGHNINIKIEFINTNTKEKGFINLEAGFEDLDKDNIKYFVNKKYKGIPYDDDKQFITIEVYDTKNFYSTHIDEEMNIELKEIKDNKMKVLFEVNTDVINIKYDGYLDIDNEEK